MKFDRALQMARSRKGLTQTQLGIALGHADGSVISKYERGEVVPHSATVARIEQVLGIEDGHLITARADSVDSPGPSPEGPRHSLSYQGGPLSQEQERLVLDLIRQMQRDGAE